MQSGAAAEIRSIRHHTGKSQHSFATTYGIPANTLRNWEQGVNEPPQYVIDLLGKAVRADMLADSEE